MERKKKIYYLFIYGNEVNISSNIFILFIYFFIIINKTNVITNVTTKMIILWIRRMNDN